MEGIEVASAGTAADAACTVSADLIEWADEIFVMEKRQRTLLQKRFGKAIGGERVICLGIPDRYTYMQPELVAELRTRMHPYL